MKSNMFVNDIFAMVTGPDGEIIAITDRLDGEVIRMWYLAYTKKIKRYGYNTVVCWKTIWMTLMNIFEMFDFDCDGLHCREEYAAFSIATADIPPDDEDWELLISQFDSREEALTLSGFLFIHECEAFSGDDLAIPDIWESLHRLGYDGNLQMNTVNFSFILVLSDDPKSFQTCPFSITLHLENSHVMAIPQLSLMNKQNRDFMLMRVYELGEEDITCDILPRIYRTEYFGMMIVSKNKVYNQDIYKLDIIKEKNVRWNFVCGIDDIMPWNSSTDWKSIVCTDVFGCNILIASYSATQQQHTALFRLVKER
uniref:EF-hand domain-containing protein n=1 Tax=Heterorhabditis bacteriophora TaxID=37862 RepID=A0A1I7WH76_HETBA